MNFIANRADIVLLRTQNMGALYLGSKEALHTEYIKKHNIKAVISFVPHKAPEGIHQYYFPVQDSRTHCTQMRRFIPQILRLIHRHRTMGHNVLVHCRAGVQRAPTTVVLYLQKYYYPLSKAIRLVRFHRPVVFYGGLYYTFRDLLR